MSESERSICWRYQEVRGDTLVFSCDCAGEGCPLRPLYRALPHSGTAAHVPATPNAHKAV